MNLMRAGFFSSVVASFLVSLGLAEETSPESPGHSPRQILQDCIQAVKAGDFERYVEHLASDEVEFQAGLILFTTTVSAPNPATQPELYLLTRALRDLVKQHTEASSPADLQPVNQILQSMAGQVLLPGAAPNLSGMRANCIQTAKSLRHPKQFLIAALNEIAQPTEVSGADAVEPDPSFDIRRLAAMYETLEWKIYTRGDHALAVAEPAAEAKENPQTLQITFRKTAEHPWKITELVTGMFKHTAEPVTATAYPAYPAPAYPTPTAVAPAVPQPLPH